jgi:hypothetical protein
MTRSLLLLAGLTACSNPGMGTAVGNPGLIDIVLTDVPEDGSLTYASFEVDSIELVSCGRGVTLLHVSKTFDVLSSSPAELPAGDWCQTTIYPAPEALSVTLLEDDGPRTHVAEVEPFLLEAAYTVDGNHVFVGLELAPLDTNGVEETELATPIVDGVGPSVFDRQTVTGHTLFVSEADVGFDNATALETRAEIASGCQVAPAPYAWVLALPFKRLRRRQ